MHDALINLHLVATSAMVGVIWMVQTVHYPSFLYVDRSKYKPFQEFHMSGIGFVVVPLMTVEFITGASLIFIHKISNVYFFIIMFLLIFYTHRENIKRLINKEENKTKIY